jgi:1,4-alpha-glucan branching enzyme
MVKKGRKKGEISFSMPANHGGKQVALAGDFTDWQPVPMRKQKNGSFAVTASVPPGAHQYKYIVDSRWLMDPENSDCALSAMGTMNSVVCVD